MALDPMDAGRVRRGAIVTGVAGLVICGVAVLIFGVGGAGRPADAGARDSATPVPLAAEPANHAPVVVREIGGLEHPWGLAFLPDGAMLVTERDGRLRLIDAAGRLDPAPVTGLPEVFAEGQGGLFDVALARDFETSQVIYLSYAAAGRNGGATALMRARYDAGALRDQREVFRMNRETGSTRHFGGRIVPARDGTIFLTLGDRGDDGRAQQLDTHNGAIVRITPDGAPAPENPFVANPYALPEIYSFGHRNIQGAALHPETGALWTNEHGPRGGDEVNAERPGRNYGWPVITHGRAYSGLPIGEGRFKEGMEQPLWTWIPSIAVSGMAFYRGAMFPQWDGDILVGGLACRCLVRLEVADATPGDEKITAERRYLGERGERIRDVRVGPDGAIWLLTDEADGKLLRLEPAG